jgi:hypothetical protein
MGLNESEWASVLESPRWMSTSVTLFTEYSLRSEAVSRTAVRSVDDVVEYKILRLGFNSLGY